MAGDFCTCSHVFCAQLSLSEGFLPAMSVVLALGPPNNEGTNIILPEPVPLQ